MVIPGNLQAFATHGSAAFPDCLKPLIRREFSPRLINNFSDWATWDLLQDLPENQRLRPKYGRIAGDPNRAPDAEDLFRNNDFAGVPIFSEPLSGATKKIMLNESYLPYHEEALRRLLLASEHSNQALLVIDLHDTGNLLMAEKVEDDRLRHAETGFHMPPVILSNQDNQTSSKQVLDDLQDAFLYHFNLSPGEVVKNTPYKGGYFIQRYGLPSDEIAPQLKEATSQCKHVIQIELGRFLYMDERTQQLNQSAISFYKTKLTKVLCDVAESLS